MATLKSELPDGTIGTFEVPEGTTQQELDSYAQNFNENVGAENAKELYMPTQSLQVDEDKYTQVKNAIDNQRLQLATSIVDNIDSKNNAFMVSMMPPKEQISAWWNQGKMGFAERMSKINKYSMLAGVNEVQTVKDAYNYATILINVDKIRKGEYVSDADKEIIKQFHYDMMEMETRGTTTWGGAASMVVDSLAIMQEMLIGSAIQAGLGAATGAAATAAGGPAVVPGTVVGGIAGLLYGIGKGALELGAKRSAKLAVKELVGEAAKEAVKVSAMEAARVGTQEAVKIGAKSMAVKLANGAVKSVELGVFMPSLYKRYYENQITDRFAITEKGQMIFKESETSPAKTFMLTLAEVGVENWVELTGGRLLNKVVGKAGRFGANVIPEKLAAGFRNLAEQTTNIPFNKALKKFGYHGLLEEIGENRLEDLLKTSFDLDQKQGYSTDQFLEAAFPDAGQWLQEIGAIAIIGGVSRSGQTLINRMVKRGVPAAEIQKVLSSLPETDMDKLADAPESPEAKLAQEQYTAERNRYRSELLTANIPEEDADHIVSLVDSHIIAMAEAAGVEPYVVANQMGLKFLRESQEEFAKRNNIEFKPVEAETQVAEQKVTELGYETPFQDQLKKSISWDKMRLDNEIKRVVYGNDSTAAAIAWINPKEFLDATTSSEGTKGFIKKTTTPLNMADLKSETQTPFVDIDANGRITGHEGRHRMLALSQAGYNSVPVIINFKSAFGNMSSADIQSKIPSSLKGQELKGRANNNTLNLSDVLPLNNENKVAIADKMGKAQTFFQEQGEQVYTNDTINIDGVEKAAKNSNGDFIAKTEEGIRNFYKWFGDSKVVDEQGRPLVVYHGTQTKFESFARGIDLERGGSTGIFFTTDYDVAANYAGSADEASISEKGVHSVYLKIENIFEIDAQGAAWAEIPTKDIWVIRDEDGQIVQSFKYEKDAEIFFNDYNDGFVEEYDIEPNEYGNITITKERDIENDVMSTDEIFNKAIDDGYNGVIIKNVLDVGGEGSQFLTDPKDVYIVENPEQIKSVENVGTFSTETANIYNQGVGVKRGATQFLPNKTIISLFETSDKSTILHELGHVFIKNMFDYAKTTNNQKMLADLQTLRDWTGNKGEAFTTEQIEKIVRGFEVYLRTGKAPISKLKAAFEMFRKWLISVYESAKILNADITPEVSKVFDNIVAGYGEKVKAEETELTEEEAKSIRDAIDTSSIYFQDSNELKQLYRRVKDIASGRKLTFNDQDVKDIKAYVKIVKQRVPKAPESMMEFFSHRKNKINADFAYSNNLYDPRSVDAKAKKMFTKTGGISAWDSLQDVMQLEGFINITSEADTYLQQDQIDKQMRRAFENAMNTYRASDIERLTKKDMMLATINKLDEVFGEHREKYENLVPKLKGLRKVGIYATSKDTIRNLKNDIAAVEKYVDEQKKEAKQNQKITQELQSSIIKYVDELELSDTSKLELTKKIKNIINVNDYADVLADISKKADAYMAKEKKQLDKAKLEAITKAQKTADNIVKDVKTSIGILQRGLTNYVTRLDIEATGKVQLLKKVRQVNNIDTYQQVLEDVKNKAIDYAIRDKKKELSDAIHDEIIRTTPVAPKKGRTKGRYDYETNKIFESIREIERLTNSAAGARLLEMKQDNLTEAELIERRLLSAKSNGADASVELLAKVLEDIVRLKELGEQAKNENEFYDELEKAQSVKELTDAIDKVKANRDNIATKIGDFYRRGFSNLYSFINSVSNKTIADKFEFETKFNKVFLNSFNTTVGVEKKAMAIFNFKKRSAYVNKLIDMALPEEDYNLIGKHVKHTKLNKLQLIDMYNAIKNEKSAKDWFEEYGEQQVKSLIDNLSEEEKRFADVLQETLAEHYDIVNPIFIDLYGLDMPRAKYYWTATNEHLKDTDIFQEYTAQSNNPSFTKKRLTGFKIPRPINAWTKFSKYIYQAEYFRNVGMDFRLLDNAFNNFQTKNAIEEKFGKDTYSDLMQLIKDVSLAGASERFDNVTKVFNKFVNNWVLSKIALNPSVFIKQLGAITNYAEAEGVDTTEWVKYFGEGLINAKDTKEYMFKEYPFLAERYHSGFNDAISKVIDQATLLAGKRQTLVDIMTGLVRAGDIGSVIYGGYGMVKSLEAKGLSKEEIAKKFEFHTLRTQQSKTPASLSHLQKSKGWNLFMLFTNTTHQYLRKIADAIFMYQKEDISKAQFAKTMTHYLVIQPLIYSYLTYVIGNVLYGAAAKDDDEDKLFKDLMVGLATSPLQAIPIVDDLANYVARRAAGQKTYRIFNIPVLADIEKAAKSSEKKDYNFIDFLSTGATLGGELIYGLPVTTWTKIIKERFGEDDNSR